MQPVPALSPITKWQQQWPDKSHLSRTYNKSASFLTGEHHWIHPLQRACGSAVNVPAATPCCLYLLSPQPSCAGPSQDKATLPSPFWMEEFPWREVEGACNQPVSAPFTPVTAQIPDQTTDTENAVMDSITCTVRMGKWVLGNWTQEIRALNWAAPVLPSSHPKRTSGEL